MASGAETPNIAALPAIAPLGACESARRPLHPIQDVRRATKVLNDPSPSRLRRELTELRDRPQRGGSVARKSALSPHAPATPRTLLNLRFHHGLLLRYDRRAEANMVNRPQF